MMVSDFGGTGKWRVRNSMNSHTIEQSFNGLLFAPFSTKKKSMKHFLPAVLVGLIMFTGCAQQHYIVLLSNGRHVIAAQKPHLEEFNFVFLDLKGRTNSVPSEYIRAVMPDTGQLTNSPSK
jgi:hypothetical protein